MQTVLCSRFRSELLRQSRPWSKQANPCCLKGSTRRNYSACQECKPIIPYMGKSSNCSGKKKTRWSSIYNRKKGCETCQQGQSQPSQTDDELQRHTVYNISHTMSPRLRLFTCPQTCNAFRQAGGEAFVPPTRDDKSVPLPNTVSGFVEVFRNTKLINLPKARLLLLEDWATGSEHCLETTLGNQKAAAL